MLLLLDVPIVVMVATGGSSSSSGQPRAHRFLQSTKTLQHRQSLGAASGSSDSSLPSQKSGVKFGRAARVGALGVAAPQAPPTYPQAPQRGIGLPQGTQLCLMQATNRTEIQDAHKVYHRQLELHLRIPSCG